jgi:hypothetical protein
LRSDWISRSSCWRSVTDASGTCTGVAGDFFAGLSAVPAVLPGVVVEALSAAPPGALPAGGEAAAPRGEMDGGSSAAAACLNVPSDEGSAASPADGV